MSGTAESLGSRVGGWAVAGLRATTVADYLDPKEDKVFLETLRAAPAPENLTAGALERDRRLLDVIESIGQRLQDVTITPGNDVSLDRNLELGAGEGLTAEQIAYLKSARPQLSSIGADLKRQSRNLRDGTKVAGRGLRAAAVLAPLVWVTVQAHYGDTGMFQATEAGHVAASVLAETSLAALETSGYSDSMSSAINWQAALMAGGAILSKTAFGDGGAEEKDAIGPAVGSGLAGNAILYFGQKRHELMDAALTWGREPFKSLANQPADFRDAIDAIQRDVKTCLNALEDLQKHIPDVTKAPSLTYPLDTQLGNLASKLRKTDDVLSHLQSPDTVRSSFANDLNPLHPDKYSSYWKALTTNTQLRAKSAQLLLGGATLATSTFLLSKTGQGLGDALGDAVNSFRQLHNAWHDPETSSYTMQGIGGFTWANSFSSLPLTGVGYVLPHATAGARGLGGSIGANVATTLLLQSAMTTRLTAAVGWAVGAEKPPDADAGLRTYKAYRVDQSAALAAQAAYASGAAARAAAAAPTVLTVPVAPAVIALPPAVHLPGSSTTPRIPTNPVDTATVPASPTNVHGTDASRVDPAFVGGASASRPSTSRPAPRTVSDVPPAGEIRDAAAADASTSSANVWRRSPRHADGEEDVRANPLRRPRSEPQRHSSPSARSRNRPRTR